MLKLIFTGLLVYFVYRFFLAPPVIDREGKSAGSFNSKNNNQSKSNDNSYEDDYIDYEEVD